MKYKVGDFVKFTYRRDDKISYYGIVVGVSRYDMYVFWMDNELTDSWDQSDPAFTILGSK